MLPKVRGPNILLQIFENSFLVLFDTVLVFEIFFEKLKQIVSEIGTYEKSSLGSTLQNYIIC